MSQTSLFRYQAIDDSGLISGALIHFRQGRAPGEVYTDKAMKIPARNPLPANSRGVAVAYLPVGQEFEITVTRKDGSFVEQFDHTATPTGGETVIQTAEPEVIEKVVEVPVEVVREVENTERLEEMEARLKAAQEALQARPKTVMPDFEPAPKPEPPAEVAELLREGHSMGDAANELARRWAEFANLRQLNQELTPEQLAKEKRLQKALNWFQGDHSIEVV